VKAGSALFSASPEWPLSVKESRMKNWIARLVASFLVMLAVTMGASAQTTYYAQTDSSTVSQRVFSQQELDQMLAPIALYPDGLLSQVLMAATYPVEVAQAAEWSRANPHLRGDSAVQSVSGFSWDPSVKSLMAFPEILSTMASRMDWTTNLGDAFLGQQAQVMDTVQFLRQRAIAAGTLRSNDRIRVVPQDQVILIQPVAQQIVYVPYYNPAVAYGSWWWPNYPPVYWEPWSGYYAPSGYRTTLFWGAGVPVGAGLFFGYFDWSHRHVYVRPHKRWDHMRNYDNRHEWQHDPIHRHGTPYRHDAVRGRVGQPARGGNDRSSLRGHVTTGTPRRTDGPQSQATRPRSSTPISAKGQPLPTAKSQPLPGATSAAGRSAPTLSPPSGATRSAPSAATRSVRPEQRPTAIEGVDRGSAVRDYSARGRASNREAGANTRGVQHPSASGQGGAAAPKPSGRPGSTAGSAPGPSRHD